MEFLTDGRRHLVCLPYSIANLHHMAMCLGIKPCWFHGDHYDLPKKRIPEIEKYLDAHPAIKKTQEEQRLQREQREREFLQRQRILDEEDAC